MMDVNRVGDGLKRLARLAEATAVQAGAVVALAERYRATLAGGGTLYFAGNGGSAATAGHVATEYVVRYSRPGRGLRAVALTADSALLTAAGNDLGFEQVFARQVEALCRPGDLLVLHSTSGESANLLAAAAAARAGGVGVVALLGRGGGRLRDMVDASLVIASDETSRIQELHLAVEHAIVELIEEGGLR
jgi:D-sedoheptulose 7-phosphate isomerase